MERVFVRTVGRAMNANFAVAKFGKCVEADVSVCLCGVLCMCRLMRFVHGFDIFFFSSSIV